QAGQVGTWRTKRMMMVLATFAFPRQSFIYHARLPTTAPSSHLRLYGSTAGSQMPLPSSLQAQPHEAAWPTPQSKPMWYVDKASILGRSTWTWVPVRVEATRVCEKWKEFKAGRRLGL
ncbi:hypothetical protein A1O1_06604, partial [Capronia coronata CBS 617.96]